MLSDHTQPPWKFRIECLQRVHAVEKTVGTLGLGGDLILSNPFEGDLTMMVELAPPQSELFNEFCLKSWTPKNSAEQPWALDYIASAAVR